MLFKVIIWTPASMLIMTVTETTVINDPTLSPYSKTILRMGVGDEFTTASYKLIVIRTE